MLVKRQPDPPGRPSPSEPFWPAGIPRYRPMGRPRSHAISSRGKVDVALSYCRSEQRAIDVGIPSIALAAAISSDSLALMPWLPLSH